MGIYAPAKHVRGSIRGHEWLCAPPVKRVPSPTWGKNVRVVVPNAVHSGADGTLFVRAAIGFTHQRKLDGTDGLEERSARDRLSQTQCRVGWSPQISRTPLGFELSALFAFSDTTSFGYNLGDGKWLARRLTGNELGNLLKFPVRPAGALLIDWKD